MKKLYFSTGLMSAVMAANAYAADVYVRDIQVVGLQRVENETVMSYLDIDKSKVVSEDKMDESLKQLYATGLFEDVSFSVTPDGRMIISVIESPMINERVFDGNDKVDSAMLEKEVQSAPRTTYNKARVQEDVQRILEVYKRNGRYAAAVLSLIHI